jgi:hypothetical protein
MTQILHLGIKIVHDGIIYYILKCHVSLTAHIDISIYIKTNSMHTIYFVQLGRSRDRFPMASLDFSVTYSFRQYHGPGANQAPSENGYQEHILGVKAAGA